MIGAGEIRVKLKHNPKQLYEHQVEALEVLKEIESIIDNLYTILDL